MKLTQMEKIKVKAMEQGLPVVEGINHHGSRKLDITFENGNVLQVFGDEAEKYGCTFLQFANGGGTVTSMNFTAVMKSFEPAKQYGLVDEVEGSEPVVGTGGTLPRYTDADPVTVVEVINSKKIVVRYDNAELDKNWKPDMHVGGFSAHTANNSSQEWNISQNVNGKCETYTLRKNGKWVQEGQSQSGQRLVLGTRVKFHDYNF